MNVSYYKPNSNNTGACISFKYDPNFKAFFINLIKQASWNSENKTGSFKANVKNPAASLSLKLSASEMAGILNAIRTNNTFSGFHGSDAGKTQIIFKPYVQTLDEKPVQKGYVLFTTRKKEDSEVKISIAFNFNESELLAEFIHYGLTKFFDAAPVKKESAPAPSEPEEEQVIF